jgi:adenylate cyclase
MANETPQFGRLSRQIGVFAGRIFTSWAAVGTIVALTGFGPEHWFATAFRYFEMPRLGLVWPTWLDVRVVIVSIGVAIVAVDLLLRREHRGETVTEPVGMDALLPQSNALSPQSGEWRRPQGFGAASGSPAALAGAPAGAAPLQGHSSIVVLPFANLSHDPEQDYFSDGISEDIITDLSKISGLFVIARNSAFVYKDKALNVSEVCRDLGVRYCLEGSIRKVGNRVRVTAQLIDGSTGGHVWAERYDRDLTDIFNVQDEVTRQIVGALKITLSDAEKSQMLGGGTRNVEAHDLFLKGRELMFARKDHDNFDRWMACFRHAIDLDRDYSDPYAGLSVGYSLDHQNRWSDRPELSLGEAERFADAAIAKDDRNPYAHFAAALVAMGKKDYGRWKDEVKQALSLNPNFAPATVGLGNLHVFTGEPLKGVPYIERAMRLDPTVRGQYLHFLGTAYLAAGDYETAATVFRERISVNPDTDLSRALLVSALGQLGQVEEAHRVWDELKGVNPRYSLEAHVDRLPFKNPADAARIIEGVRKAGVSD